MTDLIQLPEAERVEAVINHAFSGLHHVRKFTEHKNGPHSWWSCNVSAGLCTVDFDNLTRLVVAATEYGVRVEIDPAGPRQLKLRMFPRYQRGGAFYERAPRLSHWISGFAYEDRLKHAKSKEEAKP